MSTSRIPLFLAPAFSELAITSRPATRSFSSTACNEARWRTKRKGNRDSNKQRGVSAMRSTGPRQRTAVYELYPTLGVPVSEKDRKLEEFPTPKDHGLYGFFDKDRNVILDPSTEGLHGRAWEHHELVFKSFEDLHGLYWQCVYETNRIRTRRVELANVVLGYGTAELMDRVSTVRKTMLNIKKVLVNRHTAYEEARVLVDQKGWKAVDEEIEREKEPVFEEPPPRPSLEESHSQPRNSTSETVISIDPDNIPNRPGRRPRRQ